MQEQIKNLAFKGRERRVLMGLAAKVLLLLLLTLTSSMASATGESNLFTLPSNCTKRSCGNISIEYPFGIDSGCFRPGFNLTCTNHRTAATNAPPRLFLGDGTIEVTNIDMKQGFLSIKTPIVTMGVDEKFKSSSLIDLKNTPFNFGFDIETIVGIYEKMTYSTLYVVGCSAEAELVDLTTNTTIHTCLSICPSDPSQYQAALSVGSGYCRLNISKLNMVNQTSLGIRLTRLNQTEHHLVNTSSIKAFTSNIYNLTQEDLQGIVEGRSRTDLDATLAWYIDDHPSCKEAKKNNKTYACHNLNSECYDVTNFDGHQDRNIGYVCRCSLSYDGNPYISDGCQDTSFTSSPAKNCTKKCGSVEIMFPFGLREGCYRDPSFALKCNQLSNPPTLLFDDESTVISRILLEEGQLELGNYNQDSAGIRLNGYKPFWLDQPTIIWVIALLTCDDAKKNMTTFACVDQHSSCLNTNATRGYRCKCSQGYQGNPYLPEGCKDIDECRLPEKYPCNGTCTNTMGNYNCTCPPGTYSRDPKRGECIPDKNHQTLLLGVIIGVSNGIGLLLLCASFVILRRKWKKRMQKNLRERHFRQNHGLLLKQLIYSGEDVAERTKIFSLEEIEKATNNFDKTRVLGRGGHGTVYKGILSDQRIVAIKKSKIMKKSEIDQFINEVAVLSQINHRNVVKFFGCCLETEVPLLIYEFISNGALADHLYISSGNSTLSWEDRLRIAAEAAGALAYLHSAASISIFHRDVKSSNILLDDHFTAKVSDFGASRFIPVDQTHIVTAIQGTFGYLDPEYYQTSQLTEKSDVYSFGVILLELLTGKKPICSIGDDKDVSLSMYFLQALRENCFMELVEDRVVKEGTKEELVRIIRLIEMCLKLKGVERPTMKEVEYRLQYLRKIRLRKREHFIPEGKEEIKYLLNDSSYASLEVVDQANQGTSRNYSLEKEFMWSNSVPR